MRLCLYCVLLLKWAGVAVVRVDDDEHLHDWNGRGYYCLYGDDFVRTRYRGVRLQRQRLCGYNMGWCLKECTRDVSELAVIGNKSA